MPLATCTNTPHTTTHSISIAHIQPYAEKVTLLHRTFLYMNTLFTPTLALVVIVFLHPCTVVFLSISVVHKFVCNFLSLFWDVCQSEVTPLISHFSLLILYVTINRPTKSAILYCAYFPMSLPAKSRKRISMHPKHCHSNISKLQRVRVNRNRVQIDQLR